MHVAYTKMDFTTNYCGPFWSDGKFQSSVANGKSQPVSLLDNDCMLHDRAYALATSDEQLDVADTKFYNDAWTHGLRGKVYGSVVYFGNKLLRGHKMSKGKLETGQLAWLNRSKPTPATTAVGTSPGETPGKYPSAAAPDKGVGGVVSPVTQSRIGSGVVPPLSLEPAYYYPWSDRRKKLRKRHRKQKW
jgi:hypothetical protein